MKQILKASKVIKAAKLAIEDLGEPDVYEYEPLKQGMQSLELDVKNYKTAFNDEWMDLSLMKKITTSRMDFFLSTVLERYSFLFNGFGCVKYCENLINIHHASDFESLMAEIDNELIITKLEIAKGAIDRHNNTKQKLTALAQAKGDDIILDDDEIELIGGYL